MYNNYDLAPTELELVERYNNLSEEKKREFIRYLSMLSRRKGPAAVRPASDYDIMQAAR